MFVLTLPTVHVSFLTVTFDFVSLHVSRRVCKIIVYMELISSVLGAFSSLYNIILTHVLFAIINGLFYLDFACSLWSTVR